MMLQQDKKALIEDLKDNQYDVMIDDAVDLYELERTTLDKLVEQYAQEKLDNFVENNL
jgi:hypothetical protein